ncbi:TPA: hypothetical protein DDW69_02500 [candidate division CPR2 bacterium]|uniref:Resolvase helix-turn-helix domain protein n=1 Tax=candidate division CPR2 bacterium GW2011_GWC1_41_48 TaxID=1618344 RepID=A0A0G0WCU8_UNCC2|nr:MAG: hypothetical protein UT47_C0001G0302 [candidate division CPR2 bacterium GW2011_GWC2_39_35]KKR28854.1 MAG: hypothetical protein UT60_C0011G0020 [candidate division CPR2 bacterium GW2011_GWD2_39_7]KKR29386.1 MAG: hypothetical protein UT59_C0008G0002 [candidate division CPR2 bacterium GW2011_GWD1_39_7]KKS09897.1 MAG: hypothetical protein UU65_C0001G0302 [candidate division CPR2 bacterium GW2011_GWC1_41_48]OGB73196.1 MAG: hypothetical protein A2Y26_01235 [candidate division CPR2 bacterium G
MISKTEERLQAIKLRQQGYSYNEILAEVPVAKSSLSLWLRDIGLADKQKQKLTQKRKQAHLKAIETIKHKRIKLTNEIMERSQKEIGNLSKRELWLIGVCLYWAEGAKQKEYNVSERVFFGNSDPDMLKVFLMWLTKICDISPKDIKCRLHIHESADEVKALEYWSNELNIPIEEFEKTIFKRHRPKTNRHINKNYYGLIRVCVSKSTNFNRQIAGWIKGISKNI